jgi:hypothetical protein
MPVKADVFLESLFVYIDNLFCAFVRGIRFFQTTVKKKRVVRNELAVGKSTSNVSLFEPLREYT